MGKIYTIVLNSTQGTNQTYTDATGTSTTDIRSVGYFYDWSLLPEKRYKLNFSFCTNSHTSSWVNCINIFSDFAQLNTRFASPPYSAGNPRLNYSFLGIARPTLIGSSIDAANAVPSCAAPDDRPFGARPIRSCRRSSRFLRSIMMSSAPSVMPYEGTAR